MSGQASYEHPAGDGRAAAGGGADGRGADGRGAPDSGALPDPRDVREPWPRPDTLDMGPEMMMAFIRARCPWAADHTHASLAPYLLEESVELLAAIVEDDPRAVEAELADVLYQVVFHAALLDDRLERSPGATWDALQERLVAKYVRRHPHVFDSAHPVPLPEVQRRYQAVKREEKAASDAVHEPSAAAHREAAQRAVGILAEIRGTMTERSRTD